MLDNQDRQGEQRIFVITGERLRDLWQAKLDAGKAAVARIREWASAPETTEIAKLGFARAAESLETEIAQESFVIQFVVPGSIRMSPSEIERIYRLTSNYPITDMTRERLLAIFEEAKITADEAMDAFSEEMDAVKVPTEQENTEQETAGPVAGLHSPLA
jgi:hypothetical protein